MSEKSLLKIAGFVSIIGGITLLVWWILMPVFLPVSEAAENFKNMILNPAWLPVNLIGLIATLAITLGFPGFYFARFESYGKWGFIGSVMAILGLILYSCIQYYETLIWPAAAIHYPDLVQVGGALVSGNAGVSAGLIISGVILSFGYVLWGIKSLMNHALPKIPAWMFIIGTPLFAVGIVFPVRTVGIILFATATIWSGFHIRRES
jgi:hypothetical protein